MADSVTRKQRYWLWRHHDQPEPSKSGRPAQNSFCLWSNQNNRKIAQLQERTPLVQIEDLS